MFSFILLDTRDKSFIAARDAIGITPLYLGWGHDGMWLHHLLFAETFYIPFYIQPLEFSYLFFNLSEFKRRMSLYVVVSDILIVFSIKWNNNETCP